MENVQSVELSIGSLYSRSPRKGLCVTGPIRVSIGFAILGTLGVSLLDLCNQVKLLVWCARGGTRTHTSVAGKRILSPLRLPVSPPGHVENK
jgi:hypothetical protein